MKTYPTSNAQAQITHAAWDAALTYDMEEEAKRNQFIAAHMARRDAEVDARRHELKQEQEAGDGE